MERLCSQMSRNSLGDSVDDDPDAPDIPIVFLNCEPEVNHRCRCRCVYDLDQPGHLVAVKAGQIGHAVTREERVLPGLVAGGFEDDACPSGEAG